MEDKANRKPGQKFRSELTFPDGLLQAPSYPLRGLVAFPFYFHGRYDPQCDDSQQGVGEFRIELNLVESVVVGAIRNDKILRSIDQSPAVRPHDLLFIFRGRIAFGIQYPVMITALGQDHCCDKKDLSPMAGNTRGLAVHSFSFSGIDQEIRGRKT